MAAFNEVTVEMRHKIMQEYRDRLERVVEIGGRHVEVHINFVIRSMFSVEILGT